MKKQFSLAAGLLVALISSEAQKPDTAWLMVHYKFSHVSDTNNREHPYTENMVLFVGKTASAYRSYDGLVADQQFKRHGPQPLSAARMVNRGSTGWEEVRALNIFSIRVSRNYSPKIT
jgi:hypothetical protein